VLVRPGPATWTEAHGREVIVEHVATRWPVLAGGMALLDLVQLYRPAAIACGWPGLSPGLLRVASARLVPRPALIGVVHAVPAASVPWWAAQALASFDAVFVADHRAARRLWAHGVERIYLVPRGIDLDEFSLARERVCVREIVEHVRAGERVPSGIHERLQPPRLTS
jgi:hypothetical protein